MDNMSVLDRQYKEMTETSVEKLILRLSVPTIISMLVTNIYNMADTFFVGKLGTSASAAIGIVFSLMTINPGAWIYVRPRMRFKYIQKAWK